MDSRQKVTVWFGKEINVDDVRLTVQKLRAIGYEVRSPFYIGHSLNSDIVIHYLKGSVDSSDFLYVIGKEGSLMEEIVEYAISAGKPVVGKGFKSLCLQN